MRDSPRILLESLLLVDTLLILFYFFLSFFPLLPDLLVLIPTAPN